MSQQLTFQGTLLSTTLHNNSIYFTASELAKALQYKFTDAVTKIYNRNQDEFTSEMSLTVKMTVKGYGNGNSEKEVRIFSLRGAHLIAMFSKTPVAKAFRKWVLDILDKEVSQNPQPNLPLAEVQADEEALQIIVNLYHSLREAHEFAVLAHDVDHRWLKQNIDKDLGGHLLHNLNYPAKNALDKAKKYIHAKSERIMFVKGMLSLLEAPKTKQIANF